MCIVYCKDLPIGHLLQSEDDCAGHETTRYTFFIGDREVGNMTADMPGLCSFSKRGDVADVTLSVPTHIAKSSLILTVVLSNTVEFAEIITSSTNGVSSALRSNTWYTTSEPHYCKFFPAFSPFQRSVDSNCMIGSLVRPIGWLAINIGVINWSPDYRAPSCLSTFICYLLCAMQINAAQPQMCAIVIAAWVCSCKIHMWCVITLSVLDSPLYCICYSSGHCWSC